MNKEIEYNLHCAQEVIAKAGLVWDDFFSINITKDEASLMMHYDSFKLARFLDPETFPEFTTRITEIGHTHVIIKNVKIIFA